MSYTSRALHFFGNNLLYLFQGEVIGRPNFNMGSDLCCNHICICTYQLHCGWIEKSGNLCKT